jgi:hypothetical protein
MVRYRRELEAQYWLDELIASGYGNYALYCLSLFAVEDVHPDPARLAAINSTVLLWAHWSKERKNTSCATHLAATTVLVLLCRQPARSRIADWLHNLVQERKKAGWRIEVPDVAIDQHVPQGRALGRHNKLWIALASKVVQPASEAQLGGPSYQDEIEAIWLLQATDAHVDYRFADSDDPTSAIVAEPRDDAGGEDA